MFCVPSNASWDENQTPRKGFLTQLFSSDRETEISNFYSKKLTYEKAKNLLRNCRLTIVHKNVVNKGIRIIADRR